MVLYVREVNGGGICVSGLALCRYARPRYCALLAGKYMPKQGDFVTL